MKLNDCKLYLVTDQKCCGEKDFYKSIEQALAGGAKIVQLREKELDSLKFYERALKVKKICKDYGAYFIVNDRLDIAMAVGADGVHLGQNDIPLEVARKVLKENFLIGVTAKTVEQAIEAEKNGADYIGSGAVFGSLTKNDAKKLEIIDLKKICEAVKIPVFAIGGINKNNVSNLKNIGLQGICCVSGILSEDDCKKASEDILKNFK